MALQGFKLLTFTNLQPGTTAHGWWNNANSEVYRLNAWPCPSSEFLRQRAA
jgi:hypothetical protein